MTCLEIARIHHRDALTFEHLERVWAATPTAKDVYRDAKRRAAMKAVQALYLGSGQATGPAARVAKGLMDPCLSG